MFRNMTRIALAVALVGACSVSRAALPFAEDFNDGPSNWKFSNSVDLTAVASGGVDDSPYVSHSFAFSSLSNPTAASTLVFRAQAPFNSSDLAYAGNWVADGVSELTAFVRHDAGQPLVFNARLASPMNFPGASYHSDAVPSGAWTQLNFDLSPTSPQNVTYEGQTYETVYSNIGNIQIGVNIPEALRGSANTLTFDLDDVDVSVVPEPTAAGLALVAAAALTFALRGRR